ncbi:hypothetical protein [Pedobacter sp. ASV12]|uniref:hypothetical protein n=1 Tax=Pedobacter sp. ASV12 TaxID=2795120 RepID=UPI0018EDF848|nr:hypothetical protein [Pedobacter sp. ASV12]
MKKTVFILALLVTGFINASKAQQLKDGQTLDLNGISVTFNIINKESIEVKDQSFDRYKVVATVKNNSPKSFNVRLASASDLSAALKSKIVELNCLNATGARLTSKKLDVGMKAHMITVTYPGKDKDGKFVSQTMTVVAGYYFDAGQTLQSDAIFIVPKGETPQVSVRSLLQN